jgi:hypothetical protein
MPTIDELRAELQELEREIEDYLADGKVMPGLEEEHANASQKAEAIREQLRQAGWTAPSTEPAGAAGPEDPTYRQLLTQADTARKEEHWDEALEALDSARWFAQGAAQTRAVDALIRQVKTEREQAAERTADAQVSAMLAGARTLAAENRHRDALLQMNDALKAARPERKQDVDSARDALLKSQSELAQQLLGAFRASLGRGEVDEADRQLAVLDRVNPDLPALAQAREDMAAARRVQLLGTKLKELQADLDRLWSTKVLSAAREARQKAEAAASQYPDVPEFQRLKEEAQHHEIEAADREQVWVTGLQEEGFAKVLEELKMLARGGATKLPAYEIEEEIKDGRLAPHVAIKGELPTDDALDRLTKSVARFSGKKAAEYLGRAHQAMPANPRGARDTLTQALGFAELPTEAAAPLRAYLESDVQPKAQLRDDVDKIAAGAIRARDPLAGWGMLQQAERRDPSAESIAAHKEILRPAIEPIVTESLARCEEQLDAGKWDEAENRAARLRDLLAGDTPLAGLHERAEGLVDKTVRLHSLRRELDAVKDGMMALIQSDPGSAAANLESLEKKAGDLRKYFPELDSWNDILRARRNLHAALADIELNYRTLAEPDLGQRLERLSQLQVQVGESSELKTTRRRLELRQVFLQARDLHKEGGAFRTEAEPLLKRVVTAGGEDAAEAAGYLEELNLQRLDTQKATKDLNDARDRVERQADYRRALELLKPWNDLPGKLGERIRAQIRVYEGKWQERLLGQLNLIKDGHGATTLEQIESRVAQLKTLAPLQGDEWERQNMPAIYQSIAEVAERAGGAGLSRAMELWDRALSLAPQSEPLQLARMRTARAVTLQAATNLKSANKLAEAESAWSQFLARYPDDATAFLELARLATERGAHAQALRYLETADKWDLAGGRKLATEISSERQKAQEAQDVQQTMEQVGRLLTADGKAVDYKTAQGLMDGLVARYPARAPALIVWLAECKKTLSSQLAARLRERPAAVAERWSLALKLLMLDPTMPEAKTEVGQAVKQLHRLAADTEALLRDLTGPTEEVDADGNRADIEPHRALAEQIRSAEELQQQAYVLKSLLDEQSLNLGSDPDQPTQATACIEKINARLEKLKELEQLVRQGQSALRGARAVCFVNWGKPSRRSDVFQRVRDVLGRVAKLDLPFGNHLTVEALTNDLVAAQQCVEDIEAKLALLQTAVADEDFAGILAHIGEVAALDANSDFDVLRNVRVRDPFQGDELSLAGQAGTSSLQVRTQARLEQWGRVDAWQKPLRLAAWTPGQPVPPDSKWLNWQQHGAEPCWSRWHEALFTEARQIIMEALGDQSSDAPSLGGRWSLRHCKQHLLEPRDATGAELAEVVDPLHALSQRVRTLTETRRQALAVIESDLLALEGPRSGGESPLLDRLNREEPAFYGYLDAIGGVLQRLRSRSLLGLRRNDRAALCAQLQEYITAAKAIALDYEGWETILPQAQAGCPGGW